jgi:hypothetical protein
LLSPPPTDLVFKKRLFCEPLRQPFFEIEQAFGVFSAAIHLGLRANQQNADAI